jgi:glutaconate CoA-transferase subunit B
MSSPNDPMASEDCNTDEFLICVLARMLEGVRSVAVGAGSPVPGAAALLAQARSGGKTTAMILGSNRHGPFNDGGPEVFDRAAQGRIDVFFMGGGQIDGAGNINLVGTGRYPLSDTRFPGSFGTPYLYMLVPRVILFREEHSRRVLVPSVDFVSAPGASPSPLHRPGGPYALATGRAVFLFDRRAGRFILQSLHPGHSEAEVRSNTGFDYAVPPTVAVTRPPDPAMLSLLRGEVRNRIAELYPRFAETRVGAP